MSQVDSHSENEIFDVFISSLWYRGKAQRGMPPEFGRKMENGVFNTRFLLPTLPCSGYVRYGSRWNNDVRNNLGTSV